jgi:hypothetical protein
MNLGTLERGGTGLLSAAHNTITLVQPQASAFARRPFGGPGDRQ